MNPLAWRGPVEDIAFVLGHVVGRGPDGRGPAAADTGLAREVLEAASRYAGEVLLPLDARADREGARLTTEGVRCTPGMREAWTGFREGGWPGLVAAERWGGSGLPAVLGAAVDELWCGGSLAFSLLPMLTGALAATLERHGAPWQRDLYLPRLVSGEWTGAMDLTESHAGSDLANVRTVALADPDPDPRGFPGRHRLRGTKVFITWGEHDLADNVVHLVLARGPEGQPGTRGLTLYLVPARVPRADGAVGDRNDVRCVALERKLGLHGSPTATMVFGEAGGAIGWQVGDSGRGLEHMFTMMNRARLAVGIEGVALSERAFQLARAHARQREQGRRSDGQPARLVDHPDVRRMLLELRAGTGAARALALEVAALLDRADDRQAVVRLALLTPVVKAWCTEQAVRLASLGIQVHGGMGYVEDTGAARLLRDARITPIYEGTSGIQALDFLLRRVQRDEGRGLGDWVREVRETASHCGGMGWPGAGGCARALEAAALDLDRAADHLLRVADTESGRERALAAASPLLELAGTVASGWMAVRCAAAAQGAGVASSRRWIEDACYVASARLPATRLHLARITGDACGVIADARFH